MTRHAMGRRPIKGWDEQDVYTGWRKVYCWTKRAGAVKDVKRRTHRRERRTAKTKLRADGD